ncbi:unnamed protein product [Phytophthora lilii]|uniref:Unnamed protein product n=1 Tax=Phytophthora lilii TaxID=2077276 RepID=A0A9W6X5Y5_9STRA|nr:unnamed protein product [Phytophthora lilii]
MRTSGYTHDGPCEIYMGDTLALSYLNCHESITDQTFKLDYSGCGDSCVIYWYWLGVRYLKGKHSWQVYKECISVYSGSGGTSTTSTATTAPTTETSSTGSTAAAEADSTSSQTSGSSTATPMTESTDAPVTEAPTTESAPSTEAPSTDASTPAPTEKCNASRRRVRA